jgi:hypothetical protein
MPTAKITGDAYSSGSGAWSTTGGSIPTILRDANSGTYLVRYSPGGYGASSHDYISYYTVEDIPTVALSPSNHVLLTYNGCYGGDYTSDYQGYVGCAWYDGGTIRGWTGCQAGYYGSSNLGQAQNTNVSPGTTGCTNFSSYWSGWATSGTWAPASAATINAIQMVLRHKGGRSDMTGGSGSYFYEFWLQVDYTMPSGGFAFLIGELLGPVLGGALTMRDILGLRTMLADRRITNLRRNPETGDPWAAAVLSDDDTEQMYRELCRGEDKRPRFFDMNFTRRASGLLVPAA